MFMKRLFSSAVAASLCVAASSEPTLSQLIASNDNLSQLGKFLNQDPTIGKALASAGQLTIFAPSNDAFDTYAKTEEGNQVLNSQEEIFLVLEYHVVPKVIYSSEITEKPVFVTTFGKDGIGSYPFLEANLVDDSVILTSGLQEQSKVIQANLNFTQGVVHVIDKVLTVPPNVEEVALIAGATDWLSAVFNAGLGFKAQQVSNNTFFIPANPAFLAVGSAVDKLSKEELKEILEYHIAEDLLWSTDVSDGGQAQTLAGQQVEFTVDKDGVVFVNGARILSNTIVLGGSAFFIDAVLNPSNATARPAPSATAGAIQFNGASSASLTVLTSTVPQASTYASYLTKPTSLVGVESAATSTGSSNPSTMLSMGGNPSGASASMTGGSTSGGSTATAAGAAAHPTAAIGVAALLGGAALVAGW